MPHRKTFGSIPGIPIGTWWETRYAQSRPFVLVVD
jgi:hypothetical protein